MLAAAEPLNHEEAMKDGKWVEAMKAELTAIEKNETWELVNLPDHKKSIVVKWVYKIKLNPDGTVKVQGKISGKGASTTT